MTTWYCTSCGDPMRDGAAFCTSCGAQATTPPPSAAPPPATPDPAAAAGVPITPTPEPARPDVPPPAAPSAPPDAPPTWGGLARQALGGKGALGAIGGLVVVWVVGSLLSRHLWGVLRWPAAQVQGFVSERDCTPYTPGTSDMYLCSIRVGFFQVLGALVVAVVALVFRRPITMGINRLRKKLPVGGSLVAPLTSTLLFTMAYAHMHRDTSGQDGIVSQTSFPAVIGLASFAIARFGPMLTRKLAGPLAKRDRVPLLLRVPLAMLVPIALAYVMTDQDRVTEPARKEQWVIIVTMVVGYLAVVPRSGQLLFGRGTAGRLLRRTTTRS